MTINKPKKRFFYGYRILLVTFLCLFFWAGLVQYSFSLYVLPLSEEFGWGRTAIMLAATLVAGLAGLCSPLVGRLLAAYGAKTVIAAGSIIMGIGFSLLALTQNLWQFYALFSFIGIGGAAMGVVSTSAVISNWFEKRRGWAIGILGMGIGAGGIFMPFLTGALLIPSFGWRISFLISGIVIALFITPLSLLIIKSRPEEIGLYPDGREPMEREGQTVPTTKTAEKSFTLRFALRTSSFWLMAVAFSLFTLTNMITFQSHAPYLQDHNFATAIVATAISIVGIGSTIAKFSFGWLCDYISAKYIFIAGVILQVVAVFILMNIKATSSTLSVWLYAFSLGLSFGSWLPAMTILVSRNFGTAHYGVIYGMLNLILMLSGSVGPVVAGFVYDTYGSYYGAFILIFVLSAICIPVMLLVRQPGDNTSSSNADSRDK